MSSMKIYLDIANLNSTQICIFTAFGSAQCVPREERMAGRKGGGNLTSSFSISICSMFVIKVVQGQVHKI